MIIAPFTCSESTEVPTTFYADTVANILEPHGKLNGAACKVAIGTVQLRA